ncbi:MAG TPA: DUF1264 domain-containing protein [Pirellulaceae bacterium]|nr:DUF1264 domain-containing protein [Pirellulaceae bacterium]
MDRRKVLQLFSAGIGLPLAAAAGGDHHGAAAGASSTPLSEPHAHFCGIHVAKRDPKFQLITQHYCCAHSQRGHEDLFQCVLFDRAGTGAKLLGVEYIVSDKVYRELPDAEKRFWHAHTYEVLGGGLIAPGMSADEETQFMKSLLTTWGKVWHTWPDPASPVPMGEPLLIWSLMGDGQVDEWLVAERDKQFGCSVDEIRQRRGRAIGYEAPKVAFPRSLDTIGRQWTDQGDDRPTKRS